MQYYRVIRVDKGKDTWYVIKQGTPIFFGLMKLWFNVYGNSDYENVKMFKSEQEANSYITEILVPENTPTSKTLVREYHY